MIAAPGSLLWMMAHDARLGARRLSDIMPSLTPRRRTLVILLAVVLVHLVAWPAASWVAAAEADAQLAGVLATGLVAVLCLILSWMLAQTLLAVTRSLYQRGDLDLVLSAPVEPGGIVAVRTLGLAVENFASGGLFLLPVVNALALQGHWRWLGLYVLLAAMALIAAAAGLAAALGLFRLIGPRRARGVAQALAMLIGAAVALGIQAVAILPSDLRGALIGELSGQGAGALAPTGLVWLPVAAARGDAAAMALTAALAGALFVVAVAALGRCFVSSLLVSAGAVLSRPAGPGRDRAVFSADPAASLRRKEFKLLARDPWIIGQLVLQMVYTLPVALILWRSGIGEAIPAVAVTPSLVIIASQMAGSLAWIAISGEDAPEFMATAPVTHAGVERHKLQVIALIVGCGIGVPILLLAWSSPFGALIALVACICAGVSCALVNLWHPTDGRRRSFMRRHAQSKLIGLFEHALLLLWAIAAAIAQMGLLLAVVPAMLALLVLWLARGMLVGRRPAGQKAAVSSRWPRLWPAPAQPIRR